MSVIYVTRRHCAARDCRHAGRLGHYAHSACRVARCLDRGLTHETPHRVAAQPAPEQPGCSGTGQETDAQPPASQEGECALCGHPVDEHDGAAGCGVEVEPGVFCGAPCHELPTKYAASQEG